MMTLLTNVLPILGGFLMKLFALNQANKRETQKMQLEALMAQNNAINNAREMAEKEPVMAQMNRRIIILVILSLVVFTQIAPVLFDVQTAIPVVEKGTSILGFEITGDKTTYLPVEGLIKYEEIFKWATMIIEFYFGAQLAKK